MGTKGPSNEYGTTDKTKINYPYAKNFDTRNQRLEQHYEKHKKEFGDISIEEYKVKAIESANEIKLGNDSFVINNGKTYKYDSIENEFTIVTEKGKVLTFYKPEDGKRYFDRKLKQSKNILMKAKNNAKN